MFFSKIIYKGYSGQKYLYFYLKFYKF
jgi:curved DNA-binding protein CbpA